MRRFGLGWRAELGAGIIANLDRIDVIEVMAEDFFDASREQRRAMQFLRAHVPVVLHATSVGLASPERVDRRRLEAVARVVEWLEPEFWSEHLAFVRAGGTEVGHLAAPPRNDATLAGLARNVDEGRRVVGSAPLLENVATLLDPPLSAYAEDQWLHAVLAATGCDLLLDLHNAHANATNFGFDARALVASLPPDRIGAVHLAGGRRIEGHRVLDDHLHAVPAEVFELLALVDANATVILERDGHYPPIEELLAELERARLWSAAACRPFERAEIGGKPPHSKTRDATHFLATLYTDAAARTRFMASPYDEALRAGFDESEARAISAIDPENLKLAARSYERKRLNR